MSKGNIAIERFWRTLKYGEIYLKDYQSVQEAKEGIRTYIEKYDRESPHTTHGILTPEEMHQRTA